MILPAGVGILTGLFRAAKFCAMVVCFMTLGAFGRRRRIAPNTFMGAELAKIVLLPGARTIKRNRLSDNPRSAALRALGGDNCNNSAARDEISEASECHRWRAGDHSAGDDLANKRDNRLKINPMPITHHSHGGEVVIRQIG